MGSADHEQIVLDMFDRFNSGEFEQGLADVGDDFEVDFSNSGSLAKGFYRGRAEIAEFAASFFEAWQGMHWEVVEFIHLAPDRMIAVHRNTMRGRGSGAEVVASAAQLYGFRDGLLKSIKLYQSKEEALAAVKRSANAELISRFYAAANQGEIDVALEEFDPELEFDWTNSISPYRGRYNGVEGVKQWLKEARDSFAEFHFEPQEFIDHEETEQVVVVLRIRGRGVETNAMELTAVGAQIWTFRAGRPLLMRVYQSKAEALAQLGSEV